MKTCRRLIMILVVMNAVHVWSQHSTVVSILLRSQEYFDAHPNLSVNVRYNMYESYQSSKLIRFMDGDYKTAVGSLYCRLGNQVQVMNPKWCIVADATTQTMLVQDNRSSARSKTPIGIDSLVNMFRETKVLKDNGTIVTLSFSKPKGSSYKVSSFSVDIEKQTGKITSAILYYAFDLNEFYEEIETTTIPRVEIIYSNYQENAVAEADFSESGFFRFSGEKIVASGAYSEYTVIDLRKN